MSALTAAELPSYRNAEWISPPDDDSLLPPLGPSSRNVPRRPALTCWVRTSQQHLATKRKSIQHHISRCRADVRGRRPKSYRKCGRFVGLNFRSIVNINNPAHVRDITVDKSAEVYIKLQNARGKLIKPEVVAAKKRKPSRNHSIGTNHDVSLSVIHDDNSPKEDRYTVPGQFFYEGVMYNAPIGIDPLQNMKNMIINPKDVFIVGFPKSGTTWLQEIVCLVESNGDFDRCSSIPTWFRVPFLEGSGGQYKQLNVQDRTGQIIKTHAHYNICSKDLLKLDPNDNKPYPKVIYVIRNPKDVTVSYYHFYRSFYDLGLYNGTWDRYVSMFLDGQVVVGDWLDHVKGWWAQKSATNMLVLHYEDMVRNPKDAVTAIANHLGKELDDSLINKIVDYTSFVNMKSNPMTNYENIDAGVIRTDISPFMRKGVVGDWKEHFTVEQNEMYDRKYKPVLDHIGLDITYQLSET